MCRCQKATDRKIWACEKIKDAGKLKKFPGWCEECEETQKAEVAHSEHTDQDTHEDKDELTDEQKGLK